MCGKRLALGEYVGEWVEYMRLRWDGECGGWREEDELLVEI